MLNDILKAFGLSNPPYTIQQFGSGLINRTWKVTGAHNSRSFILQQINKEVFKLPEAIDANITRIGDYLHQREPGYLFTYPLQALNGAHMIRHTDGEYYRVMPFVENSVTLNTVQTAPAAFEAARQFARFSYLLNDFEVNSLNYTLPNFHNLPARYEQFRQAVRSASRARLLHAGKAIEQARKWESIVTLHNSILSDNVIPLRVMHHDTKISNILFDEQHHGLCVIDLDTVMPGYFISDVGDMMRTYLSPANEEEQNLDEICVREDFFKAIVEGYFAEMGPVLTDTEKDLFFYAGQFMIYMQALRFLTDYLNNDIYYGASYPEHNYTRAQNQFVLLERYMACEDRFKQILASCARQPAA